MDAEGSTGVPTGPLASPTGESASAPGHREASVLRNCAAPAAPYTEEGVLQMVRCLNSPPAQREIGSSAAAANDYLTEFQRDRSAWGICISILNKYSHQQQQHSVVASVASPEALHFAAQTLAAQARAGFPQQLSALLCEQAPSCVSTPVSVVEGLAGSSRVYAELRDGLLQLVFAFRDAPRPVLRQLCIALSSALIFGSSPGADGAPGAGGPNLGPVLQTLGRSAGTEGFLPLLELLVLLPEELCTKRQALLWDLWVAGQIASTGTTRPTRCCVLRVLLPVRIALPEARRLSCLARCVSDNMSEVLQLLEAVFLHAQSAHNEAAANQRPHWRAVLHAGELCTDFSAA